jgi:hypothetical protein
MGDDTLGNGFVVDGIGDVVGGGRFTDVGEDDEVEQDVLFVDALVGVDADDAA